MEEGRRREGFHARREGAQMHVVTIGLLSASSQCLSSHTFLSFLHTLSPSHPISFPPHPSSLTVPAAPAVSPLWPSQQKAYLSLSPPSPVIAGAPYWTLLLPSAVCIHVCVCVFVCVHMCALVPLNTYMHQDSKSYHIWKNSTRILLSHHSKNTSRKAC